LSEPTPARPSSTVVRAPEGEPEPAKLIGRRHAQKAFWVAHAFPGGVLDPEDSEVHEYCAGITSEEANTNLGIQADGLDYYSAAIRELFEETGVLLADTSELDDDIRASRDALNDGSLNWADFVSQNKLPLRSGELSYISHWVTPTSEAKRYSTRFFFAALPDGQIAEHCGGELTDSIWATAPDMLAMRRRREVKMIFPTVKTLESVARYKTMDELVDWGQSCVGWGITSMIPVVIERDGKLDVVLPGDRDYPGSGT
jgi:8-oxo-dGTP pyrophosphatase MutT (NUDIX family)